MGKDDVTLTSTTDSLEEVQAALTGTPAAEKPAAAVPAGDAATPGENPAVEAAPAGTPADPAVDATPPAEETVAQQAERDRVSAHDKRKAKIQKDIDALTAQKYEVRRDTDAELARKDHLAREIAELEAKKAALGAAETPAADAGAFADEPQLDAADANGVPTFKNYEEFQSAHARWTITQATTAAKKITDEALVTAAKSERERTERAVADRADQDAEHVHLTKLKAFKTTHTDFDTVLTDAAEVVAEIKGDLGPDAFHVIDRYTVHDADNGPAVIHYLAQHPDEMRQIAAKPVPLQLVALAKIDARLEAVSHPTARPPAPSVTKAPEPIQPVSSTPTASSVSPEDEPFRDYATRRNREDRERAGVR